MNFSPLGRSPRSPTAGAHGHARAPLKAAATIPDAPARATTRPPRTRTPAQPTAYNLFVKAHTKQIRMQNPGMNQNDVFAKVATLWNDAPENPKNSGAGKKKKGKK